MKIEPIITDRLIIREFELADFEAIHFYASDPEVVQFMDWGPNSEEDTRKFVDKELAHQKKSDRKIFEMAVTLRDSGRLIGGCGLTMEDGYGIVGYCFDKRFWGKGYATEVTKAMMAWGRERFGLHHFKATCDVLNGASRRVLEKCGFKIVRTQEKEKEVRCQWRDTHFLEAEWLV